MTEECECCRFWNRVQAMDLYPREEILIDDDSPEDAPYTYVGYCRRYPPTLDFSALLALGETTTHDARTVSALHVTKFPVTTSDDWCGEFAPPPA